MSARSEGVANRVWRRFVSSSVIDALTKLGTAGTVLGHRMEGQGTIDSSHHFDERERSSGESSASSSLSSSTVHHPWSSTLLTTKPTRAALVLKNPEESSLDHGTRVCAQRLSTEEQLQIAQDDMKKLLEFAMALVKENCALKNVLKTTVIPYCEEGMEEFCQSLISVEYELPHLRTLGLMQQLPTSSPHTSSKSLGESDNDLRLAATLTYPGGGIVGMSNESQTQKFKESAEPFSSFQDSKSSSSNDPSNTEDGVKSKLKEVTPSVARTIQRLAILTEKKEEVLDRGSRRVMLGSTRHHTIDSTSSLASLRDGRLKKKSDDLGPPRFYMQDFMTVLQEKNDLKEQVFNLQEALKEAQNTPAVESPGLLEKGRQSPVLNLFGKFPPAHKRKAAGRVIEDESIYRANTVPGQRRFNIHPMIGPKEHYITDVSVVGYKKRNKNYVYVIHTTWSDRQRFEIYRRYGEFFTFHGTLIQLFPFEAGKYKSQPRTLPTLPTVDNVLNILGRTNTESVLKSRLQTINDYCETLLLQSDTHVSRAVYVINFFKPYPGDTQLDRLERPRGHSMSLSVYPQDIPAGSTFEVYITLADHETTEANQLSLRAGTIVKVITKEVTGWWLACTGEGGNERIGYVPGSFLKKFDGHHELESTDEIKTNYLGFVSSAALEELDVSLKYTAIEDYFTDDPIQIGFLQGDTVVVVEKSEDGWWFVTKSGQEGWAPSLFLEPSEMEDKENALVAESSETREAEEYISRKQYRAQLKDELSFPMNESIQVLEKSVTGWWTARYKGKVGLVPASLLARRSHHGISKKFRFALSADLGHAISGIDQPPPRRIAAEERKPRAVTLAVLDDSILKGLRREEDFNTKP